MSKRAVETAVGFLVAGTWLVGPAQAAGDRYDPYAVVRREPVVIDMADVVARPGAYLPEPQAQPDLSKLGTTPAPKPKPPGKLPAGWVQIGEVVQREEVALGFAEVAPEPAPAWEDIEGNQYPRKHTLYLNFNGGVLKSDADNSAEDKSTLARGGEKYPQFGGSEQTALAIIQAVEEDMAGLGIRVVYAKRPSKTVPYTMVMVGGSWTDTNIDSPAGGVAPGVDCEARGQRHVVYAFDTSSSTIGQEAAHAWGLDHTIGADRIMSYTGGNNKKFGDNCQPLCEEACQGPGTIGCRLVHEKYCGEGTETQNDLAELSFIFGTDEPDVTPPLVDIVEPAEDTQVEVGAEVKIVGSIKDDYGGVGWKLRIEKDGELLYDLVDYERDMGWTLKGLPEGVYVFTLEAEDHADHIVQDRVVVTVGNPATSGEGSDSASETGDPPPTTSASEGGEDASSGGGEDSSGGGTTDPGADGGASDGGCSVAGDGPAGLLAPALGLGWAWARRRRRA
jgi:MYXO-CTERM domain-containing protein